MKRIEYQVLVNEINHGTDDKPDIEQIFSTRIRQCPDSDFDANYIIAQREAHGEITVEDIPDPVTEPTLDERNRADIDYLAVMMGVEL